MINLIYLDSVSIHLFIDVINTNNKYWYVK